jgi:hypothetical protein
MVIPPLVTRRSWTERPPLKDEEAAEVLMREPAVKVMPFELERPAVESPPAKVEVPAPETPKVPVKVPPPATAIPLLEARPLARSPPEKVLVAFTVEFKIPPAMVIPPVVTRRS